MQKAYRYTLIAKSRFRLSVPKVRFLLATLTVRVLNLMVLLNVGQILLMELAQFFCPHYSPKLTVEFATDTRNPEDVFVGYFDC